MPCIGAIFDNAYCRDRFRYHLFGYPAVQRPKRRQSCGHTQRCRVQYSAVLFFFRCSYNRDRNRTKLNGKLNTERRRNQSPNAGKTQRNCQRLRSSYFRNISLLYGFRVRESTANATEMQPTTQRDARVK